jgi:hypothetical protein
VNFHAFNDFFLGKFGVVLDGKYVDFVSPRNEAASNLKKSCLATAYVRAEKLCQKSDFERVQVLSVLAGKI